MTPFCGNHHLIGFLGLLSSGLRDGKKVWAKIPKAFDEVRMEFSLGTGLLRGSCNFVPLWEARRIVSLIFWLEPPQTHKNSSSNVEVERVHQLRSSSIEEMPSTPPFQIDAHQSLLLERLNLWSLMQRPRYVCRTCSWDSVGPCIWIAFWGRVSTWWWFYHISHSKILNLSTPKDHRIPSTNPRVDRYQRAS